MVLALWIICAIAYNVVVFFADGVEDAILWSNGFLLEGLLSLDNLFAYHLIITNFKALPLPTAHNERQGVLKNAWGWKEIRYSALG
eukprot:779652-Amphidinium_carterae.1